MFTNRRTRTLAAAVRHWRAALDGWRAALAQEQHASQTAHKAVLLIARRRRRDVWRAWLRWRTRELALARRENGDLAVAKRAGAVSAALTAARTAARLMVNVTRSREMRWLATAYRRWSVDAVHASAHSAAAAKRRAAVIERAARMLSAGKRFRALSAATRRWHAIVRLESEVKAHNDRTAQQMLLLAAQRDRWHMWRAWAQLKTAAGQSAARSGLSDLERQYSEANDKLDKYHRAHVVSVALCAARMMTNKALRWRAAAFRKWLSFTFRASVIDQHAALVIDRAARMLFAGRRFRSLCAAMRRWGDLVQKQSRKQRSARQSAQYVLSLFGRRGKYQTWRAFSAWRNFVNQADRFNDLQIRKQHSARQSAQYVLSLFGRRGKYQTWRAFSAWRHFLNQADRFDDLQSLEQTRAELDEQQRAAAISSELTLARNAARLIKNVTGGKARRTQAVAFRKWSRLAMSWSHHNNATDHHAFLIIERAARMLFTGWRFRSLFAAMRRWREAHEARSERMQNALWMFTLLARKKLVRSRAGAFRFWVTYTTRASMLSASHEVAHAHKVAVFKRVGRILFSGRRFRSLGMAMRRWREVVESRGRTQQTALMLARKVVSLLMQRDRWLKWRSWSEWKNCLSQRHLWNPIQIFEHASVAAALNAARLIEDRWLRELAMGWRQWMWFHAVMGVNQQRGSAVERACRMLFSGRRVRSLSAAMRRWQQVLGLHSQISQTVQRAIMVATRRGRSQIARAWSLWLSLLDQAELQINVRRLVHMNAELEMSQRAHAVSSALTAARTAARLLANMTLGRAMRFKAIAFHRWSVHTVHASVGIAAKTRHRAEVIARAGRMLCAGRRFRDLSGAMRRWREIVREAADTQQRTLQTAKKVFSILSRRGRWRVWCAWSQWKASPACQGCSDLQISLDGVVAELDQTRRAHAVSTVICEKRTASWIVLNVITNQANKSRDAAFRCWLEFMTAPERHYSLVVPYQRLAQKEAMHRADLHAYNKAKLLGYSPAGGGAPTAPEFNSGMPSAPDFQSLKDFGHTIMSQMVHGNGHDQPPLDQGDAFQADFAFKWTNLDLDKFLKDRGTDRLRVSLVEKFNLAPAQVVITTAPGSVVAEVRVIFGSKEHAEIFASAVRETTSSELPPMFRSIVVTSTDLSARHAAADGQGAADDAEESAHRAKNVMGAGEFERKRAQNATDAAERAHKAHECVQRNEVIPSDFFPSEESLAEQYKELSEEVKAEQDVAHREFKTTADLSAMRGHLRAPCSSQQASHFPSRLIWNSSLLHVCCSTLDSLWLNFRSRASN